MTFFLHESIIPALIRQEIYFMGAMITEKELDFFIEHNLNVLFRGMHGVGKTAIIKEAFERRGLDWRYFSASTMDPWVDFIGIPKEVYDDETGEAFIRLIRPENFKSGSVQVIFMDELNRAKPKVRNAVMELIQFGTINGESFGNLKMVWAAINPEDVEDADLTYDVERLDPAQKDRFDCIVDIPFEPHIPYFHKMFGEAGIGACEWWNGMELKEQYKVSPRRLEMAINMFNRGGDIRFVIPDEEVNVTQLITRLDNGSIEEKLASLMTASEADRKRAFSQINFTNDAMSYILADPKYIEKFMPFVQRDVISDKIVANEGLHMEDIITNTPAQTLIPILSTLLTSETSARPVRARIKDFATARGLDLTSENSFREAIDQALKNVGGEQDDRFAALHSALQNFNSKAALETYDLTIEFLCKMINTTKEESLRGTRNPYFQVGTNILHRMDDSCQELYDTNIMECFDRLARSSLSSMGDERLARCRTILEFYMENRPKAKSS